MKVLYFSDNNSGHNRRFLEKLSHAGLEVWFLDPTSACLAEGYLPQGVHQIRPKHKVPRNASPAAFAAFLPEFQRLLAEISPDLVHAGPIYNCGYLTALSGFHPWLLTSWGSDILFYPQRHSECMRATQAALLSADAFFCDCEAVRVRAKQLANISDSRIVQFPWGVRKGLFGPVGDLPSPEDYKREPGTHVIISTRSWAPLYGIDTLLQAFHQAYQQNSSLRLLLLGNGSENEKVRAFISSQGLNHVIRPVDPHPQEDMPMWFRAADTYMSCTQSDGTSVSLLEAMATGMPVVVTDLPSNREWIAEGQNGWLAPAGAAEDFAERLLRAARLSPEQRRSFSERSRRIVDERADWDKNFPQLLEMYERVTGVCIC